MAFYGTIVTDRLAIRWTKAMLAASAASGTPEFEDLFRKAQAWGRIDRRVHAATKKAHLS